MGCFFFPKKNFLSPFSSISFFTTPTSRLMDVETLLPRKLSKFQAPWKDPFTLARERRSKGDAIYFHITMTSVCVGRSLCTSFRFVRFYFGVYLSPLWPLSRFPKWCKFWFCIKILACLSVSAHMRQVFKLNIMWFGFEAGWLVNSCFLNERFWVLKIKLGLNADNVNVFFSAKYFVNLVFLNPE